MDRHDMMCKYTLHIALEKMRASVTTLSWPSVWGKRVFLTFGNIFYYSQKHPIDALNYFLFFPVYFVSFHNRERRWLALGFWSGSQLVLISTASPKSSEVRLAYTSGQSGSRSPFHGRMQHLLHIWSTSQSLFNLGSPFCCTDWIPVAA